MRGDWTARSGYELGRRFAARPEVTAVFAANHQMAIGALRALRAGRRPLDVLVSQTRGAPRHPEVTLIGTELVVRESAAPPPRPRTG
jgi:DNA-binding LacI/PurR family transcriptional regulator